MQHYALVIAKNHEDTLKKKSDLIKSWKKADWLYDGLAYQEGVTIAALKEAVCANKDFFPTIIVDNGAFLHASKFSPAAWKSNVEKFLDLTSDVSEVSFYVLETK
jgi:hypothetical protein